jgi:hypothetical protein
MMRLCPHPVGRSIGVSHRVGALMVPRRLRPFCAFAPSRCPKFSPDRPASMPRGLLWPRTPMAEATIVERSTICRGIPSPAALANRGGAVRQVNAGAGLLRILGC